ncbi:MAG: hypothetical protein QG641_2141 [Candidatus Poribacteria bacterium]|nr:hypothetical protein [Candidatus Poribacteria bacterium]
MKLRFLLIGVTVLFIVGLTASSYAKVDPKTCVGMWLLDDNKGNTTIDSSGNKNDGKLMGGPKWVDGKTAKALEFDGVGSYVDIPNSESLNSGTFTIVLWFKPSQLRIQGLADKTPAPQWRIFMNSPAGNIEFDALPGEIANVTTPAAAVGRWDHVAATYDSASKTAKIYFNGTLSQQAAGVNMNNTSAVNINLSSPESTRLNGIIDEVAFFNVALEAADIQTLMDKGLKESISPSAVDLSGKLVATWASIKAR